MSKDAKQVNQKPPPAPGLTTDTLLLLIGIKEVEIYQLKHQLMLKNPPQVNAPIAEAGAGAKFLDNT
jgi:hypothetical protein